MKANVPNDSKVHFAWAILYQYERHTEKDNKYIFKISKMNTI